MIVWRTDFVRCLNTDDESIIISEMKRREANIKPIIIIDTKTKKATVKEFDNNKNIYLVWILQREKKQFHTIFAQTTGKQQARRIVHRYF